MHADIINKKINLQIKSSIKIEKYADEIKINKNQITRVHKINIFKCADKI